MSTESTKKRRRRHFSPEDKAAILRRHLADKVSIADLAEEYHLQPSVLYQWQRQLLDTASRALESGRARDRREAKLEKKIRALEETLHHKDTVIAEISPSPAKGVAPRVWGRTRKKLDGSNLCPMEARR